ncbi:MAG: GNAT family N-acetyltransferase [Clostridia bacterium]|nr:GNAT family N-acetyltransferase [Clostridia bacterium]
MLDKNIPFYRIIMKRDQGTAIKKADLPEGFQFVFFTSGDEKDWAAIETSVLEFEDEKKALEYFSKSYLPHIEDLEKRTVFVENSYGEKIATFTAWHSEIEGKSYPFVHWVACKPEYQGRGIGKALIAYGVSLMIHLDGVVNMYIPTQTWSHRAIRLYQWAGFRILLDQKKYGNFDNQGEDGYEVIRDLL